MGLSVTESQAVAAKAIAEYRQRCIDLCMGSYRYWRDVEADAEDKSLVLVDIATGAMNAASTILAGIMSMGTWPAPSDTEDLRKECCGEHNWTSFSPAEDVCGHCGEVRPRAQAVPRHAFEPALSELWRYCEEHPDMRLWQAIAAWSGARAILYQFGGVVPLTTTCVPSMESKSGELLNTFQWRGRNFEDTIGG